MDVVGRTMVIAGGRLSSGRSWSDRTIFFLFCFTFIWSVAAAGDGACFRRFDQQTKACKGLLFSRPDIQPPLCCKRYDGQGYARAILRVENRKKWYECESCKLLDQSLRRESNPDDDDDGGGTNTSRKAVQPSGGRKAEYSTTTIWEQKLISELDNDDRDDLVSTTAEEENKEDEEAEEEEEENERAEEQKEKKDGQVEAEEEEKDEEGTDQPNLVEHNKTSVSVDLSPWSDWSPCSHSCGIGIQKRRRFCLTVSCGEEFEERACQKILTCPVDGGWNEWSSWTPCTVSCGNGTRTRMRPCLSPPPAHGGISCQGPSMEKELCFLPVCKVDGGWSAWSLWSVCSMTCGRGEQVRTRSCDEPRPAHGGNECKGSTEERIYCDNLPCPVDGGWSNWSKWSNCSAMCGEGVQTRSRTCDSPIPDHGGQPCDGPDRETMPCVTRINCPVDGNWTEWSRWDICSARPCSGQLGHRVRYRTCTNPRPMFGGRACKGRTWSRQACYNNDFCTQPVDGGWCSWVEWSSCTVGLQTRSRLCECPPPVNRGQDCPGINVEEKSCQSTDDVLSQSPTEAPPIPETRDIVQPKPRDCSDDESGDGSDVLCADEDNEVSADHSESTVRGDQQQQPKT